MIHLHYSPDISPEVISHRLEEVIFRGEITDKRTDRDIAFFGESYARYVGNSPYGLWAPGLRVTSEMRAFIEGYLPMCRVRSSFRRLLSMSLRFPPLQTVIDTAPSWLDLVGEFYPYMSTPNPAGILQRAAADETFRILFLFSLFIRPRHGGSFNRYPAQLRFLRKWLTERPRQSLEPIHILDTACSTGESTYELALLLMEIGMDPESFLIHGSTIEPLELFAAAHIHLPHDPRKQELFRAQTERVFASGANRSMLFFLEDVTRRYRCRNAGYDIILCNGLLGGPSIHNPDDIANVVAGLADRAKKEGIILAADSFHGGWKKRVPQSFISSMFASHGFEMKKSDEGIIAVKR